MRVARAAASRGRSGGTSRVTRWRPPIDRADDATIDARLYGNWSAAPVPLSRIRRDWVERAVRSSELDSPKDLVKLSIPIPYEWVMEAGEPVLDLVVAWDTSVNAALQNAYASRDVTVTLRPSPDQRAVSSRRAEPATVRGYPLRARRFDLRSIVDRLDDNGEVVEDHWVLEVFYEQIAEYCAGLDFTPSQRVGIAFALRDIGEAQVSPQKAVQALPLVDSMVRLSETSLPVRAPVVVRAR